MKPKAFYNALRPRLGALTQANVVGFELVFDPADTKSLSLSEI